MKKQAGIWGIVLLVLLAGCGSKEAVTGLSGVTATTSVTDATGVTGGTAATSVKVVEGVVAENRLYSSNGKNEETVQLQVPERKAGGDSSGKTKKNSPRKSKVKEVKEKKAKKEQNLQMKITVGNKTFPVKLKENKTTQALLKKLPITVSMGDLNQNEKYYYLPNRLPTDAKRVSQIHAGDLMLYGSDCLVLFYQDFNTSYSYTSIGQIENTKTLAQVLGSGKVTVTFSSEEGGIE